MRLVLIKTEDESLSFLAWAWWIETHQNDGCFLTASGPGFPSKQVTKKGHSEKAIKELHEKLTREWNNPHNPTPTFYVESRLKTLTSRDPAGTDTSNQSDEAEPTADDSAEADNEVLFDPEVDPPRTIRISTPSGNAGEPTDAAVEPESDAPRPKPVRREDPNDFSG